MNVLTCCRNTNINDHQIQNGKGRLMREDDGLKHQLVLNPISSSTTEFLKGFLQNQ